MRFPNAYKLKTIAEIIDAQFVGADDFLVLGMNEIHRIEKGEIVFVDHPKYYKKALESKASVILINKKVDCPEGKALLISEDPFRDFNKLTDYFKPFKQATSAISTSAKIGENTIIQPNVFIGEQVNIGDNCIIHPNVVIQSGTSIGNNVIIQAGTVIGGDAFYYKKRPEGHDRLKSSGDVKIEDGVEIGCNCTIDRGVSASTTIKKGAILDNQIQIGHDTIIGEYTLIASHTGIAGCCIIGDNCKIWGQVGMSSAIEIADNTEILGQSGVTKSLEGGKTYFGLPAKEVREVYKDLATTQMMIKDYHKKRNS